MISRWAFYPVLLAAVALPVLASPLCAEPRDDVVQGALRCAGITNDRAWLDCYYGAAQPMRAQLGLPPAPVAQQNLVPAAIEGAPAPILTPQKPSFFSRMADKIYNTKVQKPEPPTRMTSYAFNSAGYFTVTLANGEKWRESPGEAASVRWRAKPESYSVVIQPGPEGIATMTVNGHDSESYKVEQIKP